MFRELPPKKAINVLFDNGGLGDDIARSPVCKYIYDNYPEIHQNLYFHDFFIPLAENYLSLMKDRISINSISGGTSTLSLRTFSHTPATSAVTFSLPIDVSTKYIRVAVRESVTDVAASSAYVEMTILGDK